MSVPHTAQVNRIRCVSTAHRRSTLRRVRTVPHIAKGSGVRDLSTGHRIGFARLLPPPWSSFLRASTSSALHHTLAQYRTSHSTIR
eukprot:2245719-Rhodomonas_salina.2